MPWATTGQVLLLGARVGGGDVVKVQERLRQAWVSGEVLALDTRLAGAVPTTDAALPQMEGAWLLDLLTRDGGHPRGLRLQGARIIGDLDWSWHKLTTPLQLVSCILDTDLDLSYVSAPDLQAANCRGTTIRAREVVIDHDLGFCGSHITGLDATGAQITGDVFLTEGFISEGEIRLLGARIGGQLNLSGATVTNPGGHTLAADRAQITDSVFLTEGFTSTGTVRLPGARIGGQFNLSGATVTNPGGHTLAADDAQITESVFLTEGFTSKGEIRLLGASIGGDLALRRSALSRPNSWALNLEGAQVAGCLWMQQASQPVEGIIDLTRAQIGALRDDPDFWPAKGRLILSGLVYERLGEGSPTDPGQRLDWIRRNQAYSPQPYRQLARVLEATGHTDAARTIRIAARDDHRRLGGLRTHQRAWNRFLSLTIKHGYQPARPVWFLLPLYALTVLFIWLAGAAGMFIPTGDNVPQDPVTGHTIVTSTQCTPDYPCLIPAAYAAESFIPILGLHQASLWQPDTHTQRGQALRWWLYATTGVGWISTSLILAALTGLTEHKD